MKDSVEVSRKKHLRKRILEHLLGPFGSILFHIIVVIIAIKFLGMVTEERTSEIKVKIVEPDAIDLEEFEKELEEMQELQDMTDLITPPDQMLDTANPPDVNDVAPTEDVTMDLDDLNVLNESSPLVMKGLFAGRSASGRKSMLGGAGKYAKDVEKSVIKALEWLKNNQSKDGTWGSGETRKSSYTGLALLTFLAHGETPSSEEYGETVEKAIKALIALQEKNQGGKFSKWEPGVKGQPNSYSHAIATYAICEAYGLTRIPSLKQPMDDAINLIISGQQPGGSWDYGYKKAGRRDASVAGWQIQALKAGLIAGASNPNVKKALTRAVEELRSTQHAETGMFPYSRLDRGKLSMTGVAVLSLEIAGYGNDNATKKGLKALRDADIKWNNPMDWPMYSWYYITQAKFHAGGSDWAEWNRNFAPELIRNQNDDGSWNSAGANIKDGSHGTETYLGPVYSTTLAALTLQVYYRFLPTYKHIDIEEQVEDDSEITIEIM